MIHRDTAGILRLKYVFLGEHRKILPLLNRAQAANPLLAPLPFLTPLCKVRHQKMAAFAERCCFFCRLELLGGASDCHGDYLYRSGSLRWDVESGMWGIFRITMRTIFYHCASCCRNAGQWWEKVWKKA